MGQSNMASTNEKTAWSEAQLRHAASISFVWDGTLHPAESLWRENGPRGTPWARSKARMAQVVSLSMADALIEDAVADRVVLVPCAVPGTSITQWAPELREAEQHNNLLYRCLEEARYARRHGRFLAVAFHQGESDTDDRLRAGNWSKLATSIFLHLRRELGEPDLPILLGTLGKISPGKQGRRLWTDEVRRQQRGFDMPCSVVVEAIDLPLSADGLHFTLDGYTELGRRFAAALEEPALTGCAN
jgi:hypothetical protein